MSGGASRFWRVFFRVMYAFLGLVDPLIRAWWRRFGLGNVVELRVPGRRTGRERSTLVGLLMDGDDRYLGHPNGEVAWTRNLEAAGEGRLVFREGLELTFSAVRLGPGAQRDAAIRATWSQHPFPGDLIYSLARRHVRAAGVYFRLDPPRYAS